MNKNDKLKKFITTKTVTEYINCWDKRAVLLGGPMNTGKTAATAMKTFIYCYNRAPVIDDFRTSEFLVARHDYGAIEETILKELMKWFPKGEFTVKKQPLSAQAYREPSKKNGVMQYGVNAKFIPVSMKNIQDYDLRSYNVTGLITIETQEMVIKTLLDLYDRTGRMPFQYMPKLWFGDINFPDDMHWLYKQFILNKDQAELLEWSLLRQPPIFFKTENGYEPNPDAEIPTEKEEPDLSYWLDIINRNDEAEIKQKVEGDFAMIPKGTPVYEKQWKDSYIEAVEPIKGGTLLFSLDPGLIFGLLVSQVANDGTLLVLAELAPDANSVITKAIQEELWPIINSEILPGIVEPGGKVKTYGWRDQSDKMDSHTGMDTGELLFNEFSINTIKCGTKYPEHLLSVSRSVMGEGKAKIHPRCVKLIAALRGKWCIGEDGKPDKGSFSHLGNAFCYNCWGIRNDSSIDDDDGVRITVSQ